jgi:prepilin-type N-terminal cleavage/methylation domain-containing protein
MNEKIIPVCADASSKGGAGCVRSNGCDGFSLVELLVSMVVTLVILGGAIGIFTTQLQSSQYQVRRADAITSAQAAINILSREIGNSGYGLRRGILASNGLVLADCNATRLHFRANTNNLNPTTSDPGEDVTFYYDADSQSIVRYDATNGGSSAGVINQVSHVTFRYFDYASNGSFTEVATPTDYTARVSIRLTVLLSGDPDDLTNARNVTVESDIALRNSQYGVGQY